MFGFIPIIFIILLWIYIYLNNPFPNFRIPIKISFMAAVATAFCFRYAKRYDAATAEDILEKDKRPPILYLRPFSIENNEGPFLSVLLRKLPKKKPDEELIELIKELGPFVTISHPKKKYLNLELHVSIYKTLTGRMRFQS